MQKLIFYIIYPFIWFISILPFSLLYLFSDFIYLILYYIIGYRKKIVLNNLTRVFPNKTQKELLIIQREFYHHFVDLFVEMIKTFTISKEQIEKHYKFNNMSLLEEINKRGKSIILVGSHYGNWEWVLSMQMHTDIIGYGTYTKINNKTFERKIKETRERFGSTMVLKEDTIKNMAYNYKHNNKRIYGLLSDQSPQIMRNSYWTNFLGVRVPIHVGAEKLAKRYDCAYVYMHVSKVKRGYYEIDLELISEDPRNVDDYKLTDIFLQKLENKIKEKPEFYLWTHNRFKHEGKEKSTNSM